MQPFLIDKVTVDIELDLQNESKKDAIMRSIVADNVDFPEGLEMHIRSPSEHILSMRLKSNGPIETISNTIDELLSHISIGKLVLDDD
jgi:hypothetical protein